jgi:hypothetical protein
MSSSQLEQDERLAQQCRATLNSPLGTPLRDEKVKSEHRQLVIHLEERIERDTTREDFIRGFLRLAKNIFENSSTGSNGHRSWSRAIPQNLKTALILLYQFLQRHR